MAGKPPPSTPLPDKSAVDSQGDVTNNSVQRPKTPSTDQSPNRRTPLPSGSPSVEPPPRKKRNYPKDRATASKSRPRTLQAASSNSTPPIILAPLAAFVPPFTSRRPASGPVPVEPQVVSVINTPSTVQSLQPARPNSQPRFIPSANPLSDERIASLQSFQSTPTDFPPIHPPFSLEYLMWRRGGEIPTPVRRCTCGAPSCV
jgi:hypothetical protein